MKKTTNKNKVATSKKGSKVTTNENPAIVNDTPPAVEVPVIVSNVKGPEDIEKVFQLNENGFIDVYANDVQWTTQDVADYAVALVASGQSAMRRAILTVSAAIESDPAIGKDIKPMLEKKWAPQTVAGLLSVAKMLPAFRLAGVNLNNVGDISALREVNKTLKDAGDKEKPNKVTAKQKQIVARLNKGTMPRKVKEEFTPKPEPVKSDPAVTDTRKQSLISSAKEYAKDIKTDAFACQKIVAEIAAIFGVSLTEPEATEEIPG